MSRRQRKKKPSEDRSPGRRYAAPAACGLLLLSVALVFGQTAKNSFVNYDDDDYVYENQRLTSGPTIEKIAWAFTSTQCGNWHPLTWFSHILDCQFYGLSAGGHHLTSVLLHAAAAILLLLTLWRMSGDLWPAAFVAAVFAIHPLRVESVAWVAERKDVLSGLLFVLTLRAYVGYVRRPFSLLRYLTVLLLFALGLMAKPMLVTLPFVLLLLDYWPLGRMRPLPTDNHFQPGSTTASQAPAGERGTSVPSPEPGYEVRSLSAPLRLVVEKLPLLVLSAASCAVTLWVQRAAIAVNEQITLPLRIGNAAVSYVAYLVQLFYPAGLAVLYPHPESHLSLLKVTGAALTLAALCVGVVVWRRRCPYLLAGWLWYLGMLLPVIGLVQVGSQSMADRYTYLALIGPCIALAWGAMHLARRWPGRGWLWGLGGALAVAALMACAWRQTCYWRDSETLWTRTLACTGPNHIAEMNLGLALAKRGRVDDAQERYRRALEVKPDYAQAHNNLGVALAGRGQLDEALACYRMALKIEPDFAFAHANLGLVLANRGQVDEAIVHYRRAQKLAPDFAEVHNNLGAALAKRGLFDEAVAHLQTALRIKPRYAEAYNNLGVALAGRGEIDQALLQYRKALEIDPDYAEAHLNLGMDLTSSGRVAEALAHYRKALEINPGYAEVHFNLGNVWFGQARLDEALAEYLAALKIRPDYADARCNLGSAYYQGGVVLEAVAQWRQVLESQPDHAPSLQRLAWVLATSPVRSLRDAAEAVELAQRAEKLTGGGDPGVLDALAAAYAEAGRYAEAVQTAQAALTLLKSSNDTARADALRARIKLYQADSPYRDTRSP